MRKALVVTPSRRSFKVTNSCLRIRGRPTLKIGGRFFRLQPFDLAEVEACQWREQPDASPSANRRPLDASTEPKLEQAQYCRRQMRPQHQLRMTKSEFTMLMRVGSLCMCAIPPSQAARRNQSAPRAVQTLTQSSMPPPRSVQCRRKSAVRFVLQPLRAGLGVRESPDARHLDNLTFFNTRSAGGRLS
jgi:hypothetical protein